MNKEIIEILRLANEFEKASTFKLADNVTETLIKLSAVPYAVAPPRPPIIEPLPLTNPGVSSAPKTQFAFPGLFNASDISEIVKHNEKQKPEPLQYKNLKKIEKRNEARAIQASKIWSLLKKPNNIYSDYLKKNSNDEALKNAYKAVKLYPKEDVEFVIRNMHDSSAITSSMKPKAKNILIWAYKMHIINVIPPNFGVTNYSRSAVKPGEKPKASIKTKDKKENRSVPPTPSLPKLPNLEPEIKEEPISTPEIKEPKPEIKKDDEERPMPIPIDLPDTRKSPALTPFKPEYENPLDPFGVREPILSPKRDSAPMNWNEFLNSLSPNFEPGIQEPLRVDDPTKVNQASGTATGNETKKEKEPKTSTPLVLDVNIPPGQFAPAGGISYFDKFDR